MMPGQTLAHRYEVVRALGEGGMGQVWLAADAIAGGEVAVKVMADQHARDQASVLQVKQEFRLMAQLRHPNCCEVHDYGFLPDGQPYFTMEVVPGDGLDALRPLPGERLRPILVQLLQALAYVHQRGWVHGDIKAENVRVRPDGVVKLMDFGLMMAAGSSGHAIRGTLGYLSPEVIKRAPIDQRSDLYAVGCLAFEALTGGLPFPRGRAVDVIQAHLRDDPPLRARMLDGEGRDWAPILGKLLAKDPVARYQAAEDVLEDLGEAIAAGPGGTLLASPLVGREPQLADLAARLAAVRRGQPGGALCFVGPEGSGKTRLVAELRVMSQLAPVPFGAGASQRHGAAPLHAFVAALRQLLPALRTADPALVAELAPVLVPLLPELGVEPAEELDSPDKEKARLFAALTRCFAALAASGGLVLALEDWQWADGLSGELLAHLLRNLRTAAMMVVLTGRARPADAPWTEVVTWQDLPGLDDAAAGRLLAAVLGTDAVPRDFLAKLLAHSNGVPQLLEDAVTHLVQTLVLQRVERAWRFTVDWDEGLLPASRLGLLHRRLSFLAADALALAQAAAVLGGTCDLAALAAVAEEPEERLFAAIDQLLEHQILRRDDEGGHTLAHEALDALLLEKLAPEARARMHGLALAHFEALEGSRPLPDAPLEAVARLARHALGAGDRDRTIRYALDAGKRSTMIFANDEAARLLGAGLAAAREAGARAGGEADGAPAAVPARTLGDYTRFLADVLRVTGKYDEALPLYGEAIAIWEAEADALTLARVRTSLAKLHVLRDELDASLAEARRALAAAEGAAHGPVTVRAMVTEARALFYLGKTPEAMAATDVALARARALDHDTLIAQTLALRGYLEVAAPEPDAPKGVAFLQEACARFTGLGDRIGLLTAMNLLGDAHMALGDFPAAHMIMDGTRALAYELGVKDDETFAWINLALVHAELGDLAAGRAAAAKAEALAGELASRFTIGLSAAIAATLAALAGEPGGAEARADEALGVAQAIKSKYMELLVRRQQAETRLHLGAFAEALEALAALRALKVETGNTEGDGRLAALEGEALLGLGREGEAKAAFAAALRAAQKAHAQGDEVRARTGLAKVALATQQLDEAEHQLTAADPVADRIQAKLARAELHGLRGELALAHGNPAGPAFAAMAALTAGCPALAAVALFGRAAAAPYDPDATRLVAEAQERLAAAAWGLDDAAAARFLAVPRRARIKAGNHIAYSIPTAPRKRAPTGPLGLGGLGGL